MRRGAVSLIVNALIEEGIIFEGATGETSRGRKPKFLFVDTRSRCAVAVDIRPTRTYFMVTDLVGRPLVGITSFPTEREPKRFVSELASRIQHVLSDHEELGECAGVGIVVSNEAISRSFSAVERSAMSAPDEKSTTDARSDAPSLLTASRAAALARSHRSPYAML